MFKNDCLARYVEVYHERLLTNPKILKRLETLGIEPSVIETYSLGYVDGSVMELMAGNDDLKKILTDVGIIADGKEVHEDCLVVPIMDDQVVLNLAFCKLTGRRQFSFLNQEGVFNQGQLIVNGALVITDNPIDSLRLIGQDVFHATFYTGALDPILAICRENPIRRAFFAMDGHASLFASLHALDVECERVPVEFGKNGAINIEAIEKLSSGTTPGVGGTSIEEIERGLLFRLDPLTYRVIGNFTNQSLTLKVNIKAYTDKNVFLDSIDLYRNRDRQHFMCNLMETFGIREQELLQADLNRIITALEEYRERVAGDKTDEKPEMTEDEKAAGLGFLQNPALIDELSDDIDRLGYVRERKNKLLLYLVMTSRLVGNPLHALIVSRSGAGKSQLVEIIERLCPADEVESVSNLSEQAMFYYGKNDLRYKFVVVSEKEGSKGSEYPLRELISRQSITKAVPVKDPATGVMKTTSITVNGPISLVETTTNGQVNPENLNRCFVIGIDESEKQTTAIQVVQRLDMTLEGYLGRANLDSTIIKHHAAQRLLRQIKVFNPYAPLLTFPSSRLQMRRDHEKFLKLINVVCFLHQYQREVKKVTLADGELLEYIECTIDDYRIAFDLLADGILDYTLDDLPRQARELFKLIKAYLESVTDGPLDTVMFTRRDLRDFTSWSYAQVRNNMVILKQYEYVKVIKAQNGTAEQYQLNGSYQGLDFQNTILTPEDLEARIKDSIKKKAKTRAKATSPAT